MRDEKKKRNEELDSFWDIDELIPRRRAVHHAANTEAAEIIVPPPASQQPPANAEAQTIPPRGEVKPRFIPPHTAEEEANRPAPLLEYTPENALIRRVRVYSWKSNYRYYEGFTRDAERLMNAKGAECPRTPFFSYVPQYGQMSRAQLEWYLWWRSHVRQGIYLDTDYSYVLLYVYELINLSDRLDAREVRDTLCRVWAHYRDTFYQLDTYLPEWICDCSLLHRLPPPDFESNSLLSAAMSHSTLKEFFIPSQGDDGYLSALLAFCCNYDYRKSKFYVGEHVALFDKAILSALREVVAHTSKNGHLFVSAKLDDSRLKRDAYMGALCSYRIKKKIEVEYCSFSRSHELRYFLTDVIKYTENKIRGALGIRSRLSIYALPTAIRELLDQHLDAILPQKRAAGKPKEPVSADYEKLYELPQKPLSLQNAAAIERSSWDTTERLIEALCDEPEKEDAPIEKAVVSEPTTTASPLSPAFEQLPLPPSAANENDSLPTAAFSAYHAFLCAVRERDPAAQKKAASAHGMPLEVLADEINALAADLLGDILLEESDYGFAVIEDYESLLLQLTQETEQKG